MNVQAVCLLILLLFSSCLNDKEVSSPAISPCSEVTFSQDIKPMIIQKCAVTGCHVSGFAMGNFSVYDSLKIKVDNGKFHFRVLETKTMPPLNPLSLTELALIKCWLDSGAENN